MLKATLTFEDQAAFVSDRRFSPNVERPAPLLRYVTEVAIIIHLQTSLHHFKSCLRAISYTMLKYVKQFFVSSSKNDPIAGLPVPDSSKSFWHSEPSEFLLGHRTTEDLPGSADVVIVGTGITGTSAARFLTEDERAKDMKVVVLEAREACWGATGRVRDSASLLSFLNCHVPIPHYSCCTNTS